MIIIIIHQWSWLCLFSIQHCVPFAMIYSNGCACANELMIETFYFQQSAADSHSLIVYIEVRTKQEEKMSQSPPTTPTKVNQ